MLNDSLLFKGGGFSTLRVVEESGLLSLFNEFVLFKVVAFVGLGETVEEGLEVVVVLGVREVAIETGFEAVVAGLVRIRGWERTKGDDTLFSFPIACVFACVVDIEWLLYRKTK